MARNFHKPIHEKWVVGAVQVEIQLQELEKFSSWNLSELCDAILLDDESAVAKCVEFICAESRGQGHGRARARMCRRLKHCDLNLCQRKQLVTCITDRLATGKFSEQFKDQLRLALHLDGHATFAGAREALSTSHKGYVRRYSAWVLQHAK